MRGILCTSLEFTLLMQLSLLWYCFSQTLDIFACPYSPHPSAQSWEITGLHLSIFPCMWKETLWKWHAVFWGNSKVYFICLLSLKDHCSSLPDVQWLENNCYILFLVVPWVDSVLVTLWDPESEILVPHFISDKTKVKRSKCWLRVYSASLETELALDPRFLPCLFFQSFHVAIATYKGDDLASGSLKTRLNHKHREAPGTPASSLILIY